MDFSLSDEQRLLEDSVARFVARSYDFETRRRLALSGGFSEDNWQHFAEMGWLMAAVPEDCGGLGGSIVEQAIICEAFGKGLVLEPFVPVAILAGRILAISGDPHAQALLPGLSAGALRPILAHGEVGGFGELAWVATTAAQTADGWVIDGRKDVVIGAPFASHFLVSARTSGEPGDEPGITLFLIAADAPGIRRTDLRLADSRSASDLVFSSCVVQTDAIVGTMGQAFSVLGDAHAHAIVGSAAEAVGAMEHAVWTTRDYLNTRVQFGKPIGSFQALQHRMADMLIELEMTRSQIFRAMAHLAQEPRSRDRAISSLKVQVGRSAKFVGGNAIQLHGGIGVSEEYTIGHYFKRLTMIDNQFGSVGIHLDRMAALSRAA